MMEMERDDEPGGGKKGCGEEDRDATSEKSAKQLPKETTEEATLGSAVYSRSPRDLFS